MSIRCDKFLGLLVPITRKLILNSIHQVAQQCKENIFAIQTLKDFQYLDDNKDQGINVREKAKTLVALLKDDERLRNERVRALKAKERFAQSTAGIGSDTVVSLLPCFLSPPSPRLSEWYPGKDASYEGSRAREKIENDHQS